MTTPTMLPPPRLLDAAAPDLAAVAAGERPVVIANGAEGEPASAKDRTLLARAPHLALDGLQLAAEAVGADRAYIYATSSAVRQAVAERRGDHIRVDAVAAPDRFVAGEESAVVAAVEGRRALPRDTPRRVVEAGVRGRPTLVQNVETLAHLALIARHGAGWFRDLGTSDEPGTLLATVSGAVAAPGVQEIPHGLPLRSLVALAGGPSEPVQALLVGGYHGTWLPASLVDTPMSRAALRPLGASPGAGVVVVLPLSRCGLVESARIAGYLAEQSAGQCGPCVNGASGCTSTGPPATAAACARNCCPSCSTATSGASRCRVTARASQPCRLRWPTMPAARSAPARSSP